MYCKKTKLRNLKLGQLFTFKDVTPFGYDAVPEKYVYVRDEYDRSTGKYWYTKWDDICYECSANGDRTVYTDFTF